MKKIITLLGLGIVLGACSGSESATQAVPAETRAPHQKAQLDMPVKTKAVLVYADWCGSCKILDPVIKNVRKSGTFPGVEFVTLDYTDKNAADFYAAANAAGVGEAVKTHLDGTIKTGQLLLIDLDDQKVLKTVKKDMNAAQITDSIRAAAAAS